MRKTRRNSKGTQEEILAECLGEIFKETSRVLPEQFMRFLLEVFPLVPASLTWIFLPDFPKVRPMTLTVEFLAVLY